MDVTTVAPPSAPAPSRFGLVDLMWLVAVAPAGAFAWSFRRHFLFDMYGHRIPEVPVAGVDWLFVASVEFFALGVLALTRGCRRIRPTSMGPYHLTCAAVVVVVLFQSMCSIFLNNPYPGTGHIGPGRKWFMLSMRSIQTMGVSLEIAIIWFWLWRGRLWRRPATAWEYLGGLVGVWFVAWPFLRIALSNRGIDRYDSSMMPP